MTRSRVSNTPLGNVRLRDISTLSDPTNSTAPNVLDQSRVDEILALASLGVEPRKRVGRRRRCGYCGLMYPLDELQADYNEDGHRLGYVCDGCY